MFYNTDLVTKNYVKNSLKFRRGRNFISIISIALAAFILTAVFSIGINGLSSYDGMAKRSYGTSAEGCLTGADEKQISVLKKSSLVSDVGISTVLPKGVLSKEIIKAENEMKIMLSYEDKTSYSMIKQGIWDIQGNYPEKENEIMLSSNFIQALKGENLKKGDRIFLTINGNEEEFIISGFFSSEFMNEELGKGFVSETYSRKIEPEQKTVYFNFKEAKQESDIEKILEDLTKELNITKEQKLSAFSAVRFSQEKLQTLAIIIIVLIMILVCAYLLIYNVFYISVSQDVKTYGLLKTLGATGKQIKKIIYRQSVYLGSLGILIGVAIGLAVSMYGLPALVNHYSNQDVTAFWNFHISIILFSVLFTFATVFVSAGRPAKRMQSLSAIESLRYMENEREIKNKRLKTSKNQSISTVMAYRNMFSNKKRSIFVLVSLSLGLIIFLCVSTVVASISPKHYVDSVIDSTIELSNEYVMNEEGKYILADALTEELAQEIKNTEGVADVYLEQAVKYHAEDLKEFDSFIQWMEKDFSIKENEIRSNFSAEIIGLDAELFEKYKGISKKELEKFQSGKYYYIGSGYKKEFIPPEKVEAVLEDGSRQIFSFGGYIDMGIFIGGSDGHGLNLIVPETELEKIAGKNKIKTKSIYIYAGNEREHEVIQNIESLLSGNKEIDILSVEDVREDTKFIITMLTIIGNGFSLIFVFLGIMNFISLISAGIQARKKEISILESIGMTKKQILSMLIKEGIGYAIVSVGVMFTAGLGFTVLAVKILANMVQWVRFTLPPVTVGVVCIMVIMVCVLIPVIMYRGMAKEELMERIRYE